MIFGLALLSFVILGHSMGGEARTLSALWQSNTGLLSAGSLLFGMGLLFYFLNKNNDL